MKTGYTQFSGTVGVLCYALERTIVEFENLSNVRVALRPLCAGENLGTPFLRPFFYFHPKKIWR